MLLKNRVCSLIVVLVLSSLCQVKKCFSHLVMLTSLYFYPSTTLLITSTGFANYDI